MSPDVDVAVVGAGIAGLTAAHELRRAGLDVRVYEAAAQVGGRMTSVRQDGYTIDTGAEQISPHGYRASWELLARLGITDVEVPRIGHPIAMWRDGRAHPGFGEPRGLFTGAGLTRRARLDLLRFQVWARRAGFDEDHPERSPLGAATVAEFARRYHTDLYDYLFQPASTFFFWDPRRSTASVLVNLLLSVGSTATWRTYRDGMDTPTRRLAADLDVETGRPVHEVIADGSTARLRVGADTVTARSVLLCVPAPVAAELHANPPQDEVDFLRACTFTSALKVSCLLSDPLEPPGRGRPYLLVTPEAEDDTLAAIIFDHVKHPGRAPTGKGLLTVMPNAATAPGLLEATDDEVIAQVTAAVPRYLPGFDAVHRGSSVHRHRHAVPEATPTALQRLASFRGRAIGPVDYAGDWVLLRPASEGAVRAGALAASRTLCHLGSSRSLLPSTAVAQPQSTKLS
ncbi:protoporphyrinogen/coproporphyrinogen oxidase [Parasphingorhabdus pacifica]